MLFYGEDRGVIINGFCRTSGGRGHKPMVHVCAVVHPSEVDRWYSAVCIDGDA